MQKAFRTAEFARRAGVTVRTLHHYDRCGLLRPRRSDAGYRLYTESDFARLQQIVTLKFIGLPLARIRQIVSRFPRVEHSTVDALRAQRRLLELKRDQISTAIAALTRAERMLPKGDGPHWELFCEILDVIAVHNSTQWDKVHAKYFTAEQRADFARRADPKLAEEGTRKWMALLAEVEDAVRCGEDPGSDRARDLARRWNELCDAFVAWAAAPGSKMTRAGVQSALSKMYGDRKNWPAGVKPPFSDAALNFIRAAQRRNR